MKKTTAPKRVTIRAIAEAAGVSRGTVDRALNGRSDINDEVADRVRGIARELGYVPNKAAKALRFNHAPRVISVLLPNTGSGFFDQLVAGVNEAEAELEGMGFHTEVHFFDPRSHEMLIGAIRHLDGVDGSPRADAVVVTGPDTPDVRAAVEELIAHGVPVITTNSDIQADGRLCFVGQDLETSGLVAGELMAKITPTPGRIIAVTGSMSFQAHHDRIVGFERGIATWGNGLEVDVREGLDTFEPTTAAVTAAFRDAEAAGIAVVGLYMATGSIDAALKVVERWSKSDRRDPGTPRIRVITNDALPVTVEGIRRGVIDFSILQDAAHQGSTPVRLLAEYLLSGKQPAHRYRSPIQIMGASNMDELAGA